MVQVWLLRFRLVVVPLVVTSAALRSPRQRPRVLVLLPRAQMVVALSLLGQLLRQRPQVLAPLLGPVALAFPVLLLLLLLLLGRLPPQR